MSFVSNFPYLSNIIFLFVLLSFIGNIDIDTDTDKVPGASIDKTKNKTKTVNIIDV